MNNYTDYIVDQTVKILSIDSPTGFTGNVARYVMDEYRKLGFEPIQTQKGGILVCVNDGKTSGDALLLEAHIDTLGAMVCEINGSGRLALTPLGGMNANNAEAENCRVYTRDGRVYSGTFQLKDASIHVNGKYSSTERTYDTMEVVLDEIVENKSDVENLGIMTGDIVCFDPRIHQKQVPGRQAQRGNSSGLCQVPERKQYRHRPQNISIYNRIRRSRSRRLSICSG